MWYAVNLLFESVHDGQPSAEDLWEERILLIEATDETQARKRAETLANAEEHEYLGATGDNVAWRFRRLERVFAIDADILENGTELFSRFLQHREVESLLTPFNKDPIVVNSTK